MLNRPRIAAALTLPWLGIASAAAQIVTDGSMGPAANLVGPDFTIGEGLGSRFGANLFHSFADFNVLQGQSATFTSNFAGTTDNVISRVTGANPSLIDGLLRSEIGGADFWFINPNGLVFGQNAVLDVPAGFHASTADLIELEGGGSFRATNPNASSLTIAPPSAFGFLDATVGSISVNGANLSVANGSGLSLVGGAITLQGGASLQALSGRVDLVALASAGEVAVDADAGAAPDVTGASSFGGISLFGSSTVDAGASGAQAGGTIAMVGSEISVFEGSSVDVGTSGSADAGAIVVESSSELTVADGGSLLAESTSAAANAGDAGRLLLTAPVIDLHSGGLMSVDTTDGAGGLILMNAGALELRDTVSTQVSADTHGEGRGGDIVIRGFDATDDNVTAASSVVVALGSSIHSNSTGSGAQAGQAGTVTINANTMRLVQGGFLSVTTDDGAGTDGQGNAVGGAIDIHTNLFVTEETGFLLAGSTGAGQGGDISIQAFNPDAPFAIFSLLDGAIVTSTSGTGDAGSITLGSATAPVDVLQLGTPNLLLDDSRGLFSESTAVGPDAGAAGSITVFADRVDIDGAQLSVSTVDGSQLDGAGNPVGGSINLNFGTLHLGPFGAISAATSGAGAGGSITILANDPDTTDARPAIEIIDGLITTSTSGTGDAGSITLGSPDAPIDFLWVHDFEYDAPFHVPNSIPHGLSSNSTAAGGAAGASGEITVYANRVELRDGVGMTASTRGGVGGTIELHAEELRLLEAGRITAGTIGRGDAGDIAITGLDGAMDLLSIEPTQVAWPLEAGIFTSSTFSGDGAGDAGNVTIEALDIEMSGGFISAATFNGVGGSVDIRVDRLQISDAGIFANTTGEGDGGQVLVHGASASAAALVEMTTGGRISTSSQYTAQQDPEGPGLTAGDAGDLTIMATELWLHSDDIITRAPLVDGKTYDGAGGTVALFVDTLTLDGGVIQSDTGGQGNAGTISITGTDGGPTSLIEIRSPTSYITTSSNTLTNVTAGDAGSIDIEARNINILAGGILSNTPGTGAGGSIHIAVDNLSLQGPESLINVGTSGPGNAGNIAIEGIEGAPATSVTLSDGASIRSESALNPLMQWDFLGSAGSISISALAVALDGSAEMSVDTASEEGGGVIDLGVDALTISGGSAINARTSGFGLAGDISIHGVDGARSTSISLTGEGSRISSASTASGELAGAAGNINISADTVNLADSASIDAETVDGQGGAIAFDVGQMSVAGDAVVTTSALGNGAGGSIAIVADGAVILDGGRIVASSVDTGPDAGSAGDISITAAELRVLPGATGASGIDASTVDGAGGSIAIAVDALTMEGGSIQASTSGSGDGGSIAIDATGTALLEGGVITASSTSTGPTAGSAGDISIAAGELRIVAAEGSESGIDASTVDGAGGSIAIAVDDMTLEGGSIQASTSGSGEGGSIVIDAVGTVQVNAGQLVAESSGAGASGSVTVAADELFVQDGGSISVRSTGSGRAGSVIADLGSLFMSGLSQIDATATSSLAGNVELNVSEVALLQDSIISGLSADPENDGGNFIIQHPEALILQRSSILANSASGAGGNISISADAIVLDTASTVEATGQVLTTGEILGNVVQLDSPVVVDAAAALDTRCSSQAAGERSSMVVHATPAGAVREPYLSAGAAVATAPCGK